MPRQVLTLLKTLPGADPDLDRMLSELRHPTDLHRVFESQRSGVGVLHWMTWLDPWLMFNDLDPTHWSFEILADVVAEDCWRLDLTRSWDDVQRKVKRKQQWQEQTWLPWQLWQAYQAFEAWNGRAALYYSRNVVGGVLSDEEVAGIVNTKPINP